MIVVLARGLEVAVVVSGSDASSGFEVVLVVEVVLVAVVMFSGSGAWRSWCLQGVEDVVVSGRGASCSNRD